MSTRPQGRSSICHGRATRRSVLNSSVFLTIAAEMALFLRFTAIPSQVGPGVRIRLAPAASPMRTRPTAAAAEARLGDATVQGPASRVVGIVPAAGGAGVCGLQFVNGSGRFETL